MNPPDSTCKVCNHPCYESFHGLCSQCANHGFSEQSVSPTSNATNKFSDPVAVDLMLKFNEAAAEQAPLDEWSAERFREASA